MSIICILIVHARTNPNVSAEVEAAWCSLGTSSLRQGGNSGRGLDDGDQWDNIRATSIVIRDATMYEPWIDALLETVSTTASATANTPEGTILYVHGNAPEHWIRYMDTKNGIQASRVVREELRLSSPDAAVTALLHVMQCSDSDLDKHTVDRVEPLVSGVCPMVDAITATGLGISCMCKRMIEYCVTSSGKKKLRQWLSDPKISGRTRTARLDAIESLALQRDVLSTTQKILRSIGTIHAIETMWKMQTLPKPERAASFLRLSQSLNSLVELHECSACFSKDDVVLINRAQFLIEKLIDEAQFPDRMCIHYGICPELDDLKTTYFGLDAMMKRLMTLERERIPRELLRGSSQIFSWCMIHVHNVGVFIHTPDGLLPRYLEDILCDWVLAFEPGCLQDDLPGALYVSDSCRALFSRYGSTILEIIDREAAICNQLTQKLLTMHDSLQQAFEVAAEMDCICALARMALDEDLSRPEFSKSVLSIRGGWNPLYRSNYIPSDVLMDQRGKSMIFLGSPGAGKGMLLKQVGIICFLGCVGCYVPAKYALIPDIDRIFALIGSDESVRESVMDSSFSLGARRVGDMLRWGSEKSLFLIESFGNATVSSDGVALASAVVRDLASTCGLVLFATDMRITLLEALRSLGDQYFQVMHFAAAWDPCSSKLVQLHKVQSGEGDSMERDFGLEMHHVREMYPQFMVRLRALHMAMSATTPTALRRHEAYSVRRDLDLLRPVTIGKEDRIK
jgi:hypothetical protein